MIEKLEFIFTPEHAETFAADCRKSGKQVVMAHGVFDVLHLGHVRHLNRAKEEGDVLIVSITDDEFVNKGPDRPFFTARVRAEMLASLDIVDGVVVNHGASAIPMLKRIKPDVYVKGSDYANPADDVTGKITAEQKAVEAHGGRITFTDDVVFSSSNLINRQFSDLYSDELQMYLTDRRNGKFRDQLFGYLEAANKLKVLIIGDAIMDEYIYVHSLGKASKENIICTRLMEQELFAGGVFATANHMASMCAEVTVLTCLGVDRTDLDTINASLKPNVTLKTIDRPGAPTTRKTRYIDKSYLRKLFEVYDFEDDPLPPNLQDQFDDMVAEELGQYDLVVVNDFGHGLLAQSTIDLIQKGAKFLAANAQSNSANHGYNMITKYGHADFVCIDAPEARLAVRDKHSPIEDVLRTLSDRIACSNIITTHGEEGCLVFGEDGDISRIPAFTKSVVDTVGAGDAFLSIASSMAAIGAPPEQVAFLGNAAGALKVGIVGHSKSVEKPALISYLTALLK
ncbi:MAG: PfkB family carbohydrate kinase [Magnetovibrio sp.]|nr:PfkB family carbohydrate kinase [Magnetovibrio sp.]